ncbi:MAG: hypothetical protein NC311_04015 [Muribaculaceae bacterium]|nr:hypothetical protein [Muribaculaceae bacterium]
MKRAMTYNSKLKNMKKYIIFLCLIGAINTAFCATQSRRAKTTTPGGGWGATSTISARSATPNRTTPTSNTANTTRAATVTRTGTTGTAKPAVAARAASTKSVVNSGTKITTANQNTATDTTCQQKFNGCMDSFCIIENVSGGRCQCSNQYTELTQQLTEIEQLNEQSYRLATIGVETIETGVDISATTHTPKTKTVDLSQWDTVQIDAPVEPSGKTGLALQNQAAELCLNRIPECSDSAQILRAMYNQSVRSDCNAYQNAIKAERTAAENKLAAAQAAMRSAAYDKLNQSNKYNLSQCTTEFKKCMQTTGGCGDDFSACASVSAMDNTNTNKSSKNPTKMYSITGSTTTIDIFASTYDILESKKPLCMNVLESCVAVKDQIWNTFLREAAPQLKSAELIAEDKTRQNCIGNISECFQKACKDNIDPKDPDGSYDMCLSRPETMLNVCKIPLNACDIGTTAKEAQESQIWQFVVARLASMRVDACTSEVKKCLTSDDRCGKDYTQCVGLDTDTIIRMCPYDKLTGCQKVYGDTDIRGDAVYDELATMVQGIMLNIDNNLLDFCQNAANEAMIKVCGDTENCDALTTDDHIGAGTLSYGICHYTIDGDNTNIDYKSCRTSVDQIQDTELGRVQGSTTGELGPVVSFMSVIDGTIFWENVTISDDGTIISADEYFKVTDTSQTQPATKDKIANEITKLQSSVNNAILAIESDPTVQFCMTGRTVPGMKNAPVSGNKVARFPQLTKQMRNTIANSALHNARENYYKQYNTAYEQQMKDYITIAERQAEIRGENAKDARREAARISCVNLADLAALPMSPPPPSGWGMWLVVGIVVAASVVVTALTLGTGAPLATAASSLTISAALPAVGTAGATVASITVPTVVASSMFATGATLTATGIGVVTAATVGAATAIAGITAQATANNKRTDSTSNMQRELSGHHELNQWNWKQVIDTTFEWETLNCHKCVKSTKCIKQSYPLFGVPKCKQWTESTTECTDTQF